MKLESTKGIQKDQVFSSIETFNLSVSSTSTPTDVFDQYGKNTAVKTLPSVGDSTVARH